VSGKGEDRAVGVTSDGFKMHLDLGDEQQRQIYFSGLYEPRTATLFKRLLKPSDVVIDGGANIGYYSLLSAKLVGKTGAVHSFEPIPDTFRAFSANVELNRFAQIHASCLALADKAGELQFEVPVDDTSQRSLGWAATQVMLGRGPVVRVQAVSLDDYAQHEGIGHIKLVKLDLEGGEPEAITGMSKLLSERRIDYLICESNTFLLGHRHLAQDTLAAQFARFGYQGFTIESTLLGRPRLVSAKTQQREVEEYLFAAPGL
jgi:FkbM family methyltransferase